MTEVPSGTVSFLFTDIEGSTKLAQQDPEAMPSLLARHHQILNKSIEAHHGIVFRIVGDSFSAGRSWCFFVWRLGTGGLSVVIGRGVESDTGIRCREIRT